MLLVEAGMCRGFLVWPAAKMEESPSSHGKFVDSRVSTSRFVGYFVIDAIIMLLLGPALAYRKRASEQHPMPIPTLDKLRGSPFPHGEPFEVSSAMLLADPED